MRLLLLSGISTCFQVVSQSYGQVTHVLLTHPPLASLASFRRILLVPLARLACIRHAASVRPEPGSNSHFDCLNVCSFVLQDFALEFIACEIDFALLFWVLTPAHYLAKLCSVFKVLPAVCSRMTAVSF